MNLFQLTVLSNADGILSNADDETQSYDYDALDRLISWKLNNTPQETYTYDPATGNLLTKGATTQAGVQTFGATSYTYDPSHAHAAKTLSNGNTYTYDANGNQTIRTVNGETFNLSYDAENRLVEVKKGTDLIATFVYDGDGRRVKATEYPSTGSGQAVTTTFVGGHYELTNGTVTKYYFAGTSRIAARKYTVPQVGVLTYFLSDHLGSTSMTTDSMGARVSEMRYKPWGEVRSAWTNDTLNANPAYALTRYTFTGQYSHMDDPSTPASEGFGLMHYGARMYDPALGRFTSADTIVPGGVQGYDRYAYVNNNPIRYNDPTGHAPSCEDWDRCNHGGSSGGGGGGGSSGGEEEEEGESGTDPDLCKMYGECGSKSPGLSSPTSDQTPSCNYFSDGGYACTLSVTQENIKGFENYHLQFRIGVKILYYGITVLAPGLFVLGVTKSGKVAIAVGALFAIPAIAVDEYMIQPGLREVDNIHQQFKSALNVGEITIGRAPGSNSRLAGRSNGYIEVNTVIGKAYVDLMMAMSKINMWNR
ncbi:MAG: RHS repeat-associated core domain-containing protein [Chloroflexi bacterium]|nr:RHS repeat-associated core domain-containing protein [Chloroflexota bacterium]